MEYFNDRLGKVSLDPTTKAVTEFEQSVYKGSFEGRNIYSVLSMIENYIQLVRHRAQKDPELAPRRTVAAEVHNSPLARPWHALQDIALQKSSEVSKKEYAAAVLDFLDSGGFIAVQIRKTLDEMIFDQNERKAFNEAAAENESLQAQGWDPLPMR